MTNRRFPIFLVQISLLFQSICIWYKTIGNPFLVCLEFFEFYKDTCSLMALILKKQYIVYTINMSGPLLGTLYFFKFLFKFLLVDIQHTISFRCTIQWLSTSDQYLVLITSALLDPQHLFSSSPHPHSLWFVLWS